MTEEPTDHAEVFSSRQALTLTPFGDGRIMNSVIIEGFFEVCHSPFKCHGSPEFPIAAVAEAFVRPADSSVDSF
jgi:hypothetical protein